MVISGCDSLLFPSRLLFSSIDRRIELADDFDRPQQTGHLTSPSFLSHLIHLKAMELNLKWRIVDFLEPLHCWQAINFAFPQQRHISLAAFDI